MTYVSHRNHICFTYRPFRCHLYTTYISLIENFRIQGAKVGKKVGLCKKKMGKMMIWGEKVRFLEKKE